MGLVSAGFGEAWSPGTRGLSDAWLTPGRGPVAIGVKTVTDHLTLRSWVNTKLSLTNWGGLHTNVVVTCSYIGAMGKEWPVFLSQTWRTGMFYPPELL